MAKYGNYSKKTSSGPPNTFTAKITVPNNPNPRYMANCKIWNGVLVQLTSVGRGKKTEKGGLNAYGEGDMWEEWEYYAYIPKPIYCTAKFDREDLKDEIPKLDQACGKKQDYSECFAKYREYMFVMGDNGHGYIVEDSEQAQLNAIRASKTVHIFGAFRGYKIIERLPADIWAKIKPYATYYSKDQIEEWYEDMDDFDRVDDARSESGWNYSHEAIEALIGMGWTVMYRDEALTSLADMPAIDARRNEENRIFIEAQHKRNMTKRRLDAALRALPYEYLTEEQADAIKKLPMLIFRGLGWEGADIYGGGYWAHQDENYFYRIINNGSDGGDWSLNNYRTGGAGAIAYRTPLTDEVKAILTKIKAFEVES